jgi:hypothetical protein
MEEGKKADTTNPFNEGVSYSDFLSNVKGNVTVESMLKRHSVSKSSTSWIIKEIEDYKNLNKK